MRNVLFVLGILAGVASAADNDAAIRSVVRALNDSLRKPDAKSLRALFTSTAEYRDGWRIVAGADAVAALLSEAEVWSERTPPVLHEERVRMVGGSAAIVDAQLVRYGSTTLKSSVPVVLLLENEAGRWKIASWRMFGCGVAERAARARVP